MDKSECVEEKSKINAVYLRIIQTENLNMQCTFWEC